MQNSDSFPDFKNCGLIVIRWIAIFLDFVVQVKIGTRANE